MLSGIHRKRPTLRLSPEGDSRKFGQLECYSESFAHGASMIGEGQGAVSPLLGDQQMNISHSGGILPP